jgi:hypothetical protein
VSQIGRRSPGVISPGPPLLLTLSSSTSNRCKPEPGDGPCDEVAAVPDPPAACVAPTAAGLMVGTTGAHLFRVVAGALVRLDAFEAVEGREAWYTPWGRSARHPSIAVDLSGAIYVNVHVGGVVPSTDGGRSWRPTLDIETDVHQVLAHPDLPDHVFAASAVGLAMSADGGQGWRILTKGLHARYLRAVTVAGETVLVSASTGPGGRRAALYRTRADGHGEFERCRQGHPEWLGDNVDTHCWPPGTGPWWSAPGTAAWTRPTTAGRASRS